MLGFRKIIRKSNKLCSRSIQPKPEKFTDNIQHQGRPKYVHILAELWKFLFIMAPCTSGVITNGFEEAQPKSVVQDESVIISTLKNVTEHVLPHTKLYEINFLKVHANVIMKHSVLCDQYTWHLFPSMPKKQHHITCCLQS